MSDLPNGALRPRPLIREEALVLTTDLLVKDPAGVGDSNILFASNISWLADYSTELDPTSEDLYYLITAGESFYDHATPEQKTTRTFAECARMLAVAYNHSKQDRSKTVFYQECASQCPSVKEKIDQFLGDALLSVEKLLDRGEYLPELAKVTTAGLAGNKLGSDRAAQWAVLAGFGSLQAGNLTDAQEYYRLAEGNEKVKKSASFTRLQKELKAFEKKMGGAIIQDGLGFFGRISRMASFATCFI
jgi:hypothetical protein